MKNLIIWLRKMCFNTKDKENLLDALSNLKAMQIQKSNSAITCYCFYEIKTK
jgi:hypothetical protein